jgi:hypothetical protein
MMTPFKCGREDIFATVLRTSKGDAPGTNGNSPSPYNLLIERPLPGEGKFFPAAEANTLAKDLNEDPDEFYSSSPELKSNHGFTELSGE